MEKIVAQTNPLDFIGGINAPDASVAFLSLGFVLKLVLMVILLGYLFYAFLLVLRVRILSDSLNVPLNRQVKGVVFLHLLFAIIGSTIVGFIILFA